MKWLDRKELKELAAKQDVWVPELERWQLLFQLLFHQGITLIDPNAI